MSAIEFAELIDELGVVSDAPKVAQTDKKGANRASSGDGKALYSR